MQTMLPAPKRPMSQQLAALKNANEIRSKRAQLKRDLKAGKVKIVRVVLDPPDYISGAKVSVILEAMPMWGPVRVKRLLNSMDPLISTDCPFEALAWERRKQLVAALG